MIKVEVTTNTDGYINVEIDGHADPKICAAVSALIQSNIRYMQDLSKEYPGDLEVNIQEVR